MDFSLSQEYVIIVSQSKSKEIYDNMKKHYNDESLPRIYTRTECMFVNTVPDVFLYNETKQIPCYKRSYVHINKDKVITNIECFFDVAIIKITEDMILAKRESGTITNTSSLEDKTISDLLVKGYIVYEAFTTCGRYTSIEALYNRWTKMYKVYIKVNNNLSLAQSTYRTMCDIYKILQTEMIDVPNMKDIIDNLESKLAEKY